LDEFVVRKMHPVMLRDVPSKTHSMTRKIKNNEEISKIYDFVAYPKAASVIRMIESIMGFEVFRKSLVAFIRERFVTLSFCCCIKLLCFHAAREDIDFLFEFFFIFHLSSLSCRSYKTATDEQLYEILENERRKLDPSANYPPIPEIFRSWANNPGYPILNVELFPSNSSIKVSQELFEPQIGKNSSSSFLIVYTYLPMNNAMIQKTNWIQIDEVVKHHTIAFESDSFNWTLFNVKQTGKNEKNYIL
jgi:aminopeptidase N